MPVRHPRGAVRESWSYKSGVPERLKLVTRFESCQYVDGI